MLSPLLFLLLLCMFNKLWYMLLMTHKINSLSYIHIITLNQCNLNNA